MDGNDLSLSTDVVPFRSLLNNNLAGSLPSSLSSVLTLTTLNLDGNSLSGSIPAALGSLTNLLSLNLDSNQLSSSLPVELSSLVALTALCALRAYCLNCPYALFQVPIIKLPQRDAACLADQPDKLALPVRKQHR